MFITVALIPLLIHYAYRFEFVDFPNERKVHTSAIPRVGGIAIVIGALIPIFIWLNHVTNVFYLTSAMAVILCFGAWDDRRNIDYRLKLLGQIVAALIVVLLCDVRIYWLPLLTDFKLPEMVSIPVTVFCLVGVTNAVNFSDGLDGLAGGTTLLSFGLVAVISYMVGDFTLLVVSLAVMGSLLGFLRYNTHPASIFMGDSGSQFLGFTIATLTILLTQQSDVGLSPVLPLLLLGLPIFDTLMVIAIRLYRGRSPFSPDRNHLHHQLLDAGFHHYDVVMMLYMLQGFLTVACFFLRYQSDILLILTYMAFCGALLLYLYRLRTCNNKHEFTTAAAGEKKSLLTLNWRFLADSDCNSYGISHILEKLIAVALPLTFILSAMFSVEASVDIVILSGVLIFISLACAVRITRSRLFWIERAHIYILCSLAIYLYHYIPNEKMSVHDFLSVAYITLFLAVILVFRFSTKKGFEITTLDYLVIFMAFSLPYISSIGGALPGASSISIMIILFYVVEYILNSFHISAKQIRYAAALTNICMFFSLSF